MCLRLGVVVQRSVIFHYLSHDQVGQLPPRARVVFRRASRLMLPMSDLEVVFAVRS